MSLSFKQHRHHGSRAFFLVGCPRSGTTLLQSILAAHPQIASFPESHFFRSLVPEKRWKRPLGLASPDVRRKLADYLHEIGQQELKRYIPSAAFFMRDYARCFQNILGILTEKERKRLWLEKTPSHLYVIKFIEKYVKEAKFIHIIRSGTDVVASLYEVTNKYPDIWMGPYDIDKCMERWTTDVSITLKYLNKANHKIVHYEEIVDNTSATIKILCEFMGVNFDPIMLAAHKESVSKVTLPKERWKDAVSGYIKNANANKFFTVFDKKQQDYILDYLPEIRGNRLVACRSYKK